MISRVLLLSALIGWGGLNLLPPSPPEPLTAHQLQVKGKAKRLSNICDKKKKSKKVKQLCNEWGRQ
jgi:hypothetical protein